MIPVLRGHMVSLTDVQTPLGWNKIQVIWDLSVTAIDPGTCEYTNLVLSYPTRAFLDALTTAGQTFEQGWLYQRVGRWAGGQAGSSRQCGRPVIRPRRHRARPPAALVVGAAPGNEPTEERASNFTVRKL